MRSGEFRGRVIIAVGDDWWCDRPSSSPAYRRERHEQNFEIVLIDMAFFPARWVERVGTAQTRRAKGGVKGCLHETTSRNGVIAILNLEEDRYIRERKL